MTVTDQTTVREIVVRDYRAAAVFERYGIDFCCGGNRSLREACEQRDVSTDDVIAQVVAACRSTESDVPRFAEWPADSLIAYIVENHHGYVRRALPALVARARKVAEAHGAPHPELVEIAALVDEVADEMASHMAKEEVVLFPYIERLAEARRRNQEIPPAPFGSIDKPILMMEHEHEDAGRAMARIRALSRDYTLPEEACLIYTICFRELEAFERDLRVHVHLENNVLFPMARAFAGLPPASAV